jgi:hypothetical protein
MEMQLKSKNLKHPHNPPPENNNTAFTTTPPPQQKNTKKLYTQKEMHLNKYKLATHSPPSRDFLNNIRHLSAATYIFRYVTISLPSPASTPSQHKK